MGIKIIIKKDYVCGNPHIEGTRNTVFDIVTACENNKLNKVLSDFEISKSDLLGILNYCENQICKKELGFCGGCILLDEHKGVNTKKDFINCFSRIKFEDSNEVVYGNGQGLIIMPGTSKELDNNWKGLKTWLIAKKQNQKMNQRGQSS